MSDVTTYRGPSTNFKTNVVVSNGQPCGSKDYKEARIWVDSGNMYYILSDGYKFLTPAKPVRNNLKSAINIVEYHITPKPWYCRG
jgi:hypothetical protein